VTSRTVPIAAAAAVTASLLVTACAGAVGSSAAGPPPFALRPTVVCLQRRHVVVTPVRPTNRRLQALHDLAQKTSREARLGKVVVGLAFEQSSGNASLLYELLQVPKDPLRLEQRRNVVLLSPRRASALRTFVLRCLRS
jgi:hypothetical protein